VKSAAGHKSAVWSVDYSGDGSRFATGSHDGTALVWDAVKLVPSAALDHRDKGHAGCVWSVAFSGNGSRLATACSDRLARVWDSSSGKLQQILKGHSCYVLSVAFSTDGRRVLTTSSDKSAKLWDVEIKGMNAEDALSAGIVDEKGT